MGGYVHTLTEKVAYLISLGDDSSRTPLDRWVEAEQKVIDYIELRGWTDPENNLAWSIHHCSLPSEYQGDRRIEMAWKYTSEDVLELPQVVMAA
jgi:hypothetical protein